MTILSRLKRAISRKTDVITFSRLDYWTMLELFDRIPLHDLVRLNGLASWWSGYVDKVCLTKRSIAVLCGCKTYQSISGDDDTTDKVHVLKVVTIDSTTADRIGRLLPNITSLEVIIGGRQSFCLSDVTYLINQWSHQLVDLKFWCTSTFLSVDAISKYDQFYGFLLVVNRITTLRRLTIRSDQCRLKEPIDLPILTQLEYFYFRSGRSGRNDFAKLRTSLVQYAGPNLALRQIALPTFEWYHHMHDDWDLEPQLLSKFTMLRIIEATQAEWSLFPNLDFADHLLILESRSRFMEHISEMQHSHAHTVNIAFRISRLFDRNSDQVLARPPPLQFITKLQLTILVWQKEIVNLYTNFKSLKLDHRMLPNVRTVHLKYICIRMNSCLLRDNFFKIPHLILYGMLMLRVQRDFPDANCTFEQDDVYKNET